MDKWWRTWRRKKFLLFYFIFVTLLFLFIALHDPFTVNVFLSTVKIQCNLIIKVSYSLKKDHNKDKATCNKYWVNMWMMIISRFHCVISIVWTRQLFSTLGRQKRGPPSVGVQEQRLQICLDFCTSFSTATKKERRKEGKLDLKRNGKGDIWPCHQMPPKK